MDSDDQYINDARSVRGLTLALVFMCMLTVTQMMQVRCTCAALLMCPVISTRREGIWDTLGLFAYILYLQL